MEKSRATLAALSSIVAMAGCAASSCSEPRRVERRVEDPSAVVAALRAENVAVKERPRDADEVAARLAAVEKALDANPRELIEAYRTKRPALEEKERVLAMLLEERGRSGGLALPPVPRIEGHVTAVKRDVQPALVLLCVGSDDEVEKGFHFSIYRGDVFIGEVVVEKVLRDSSGCRVLFMNEGQSIEVGDSAATRLE